MPLAQIARAHALPAAALALAATVRILLVSADDGRLSQELAEQPTDGATTSSRAESAAATQAGDGTQAQGTSGAPLPASSADDAATPAGALASPARFQRGSGGGSTGSGAGEGRSASPDFVPAAVSVTASAAGSARPVGVLNPSPPQLVAAAPLAQVHVLFAMLGLAHVYVTDCGELLGEITRDALVRKLDRLVDQALSRPDDD